MHDVLAQILAAIGCAVLLVAILRRLSLPPVLGYLFVGIALGPHAFAVLEHRAVIELLGEIGIAFLLFSIGLEFSLPQFMSMRRVLLGLGSSAERLMFGHRNNVLQVTETEVPDTHR